MYLNENIEINSNVKLLDSISSLNESIKMAKNAYNQIKNIDGKTKFPLNNLIKTNNCLIEKIKNNKKDVYNELVPISKKLDDLLYKLYNHLYYCYSVITDIRIWIQLQIPSVREGYSFTIEIQEEIVNKCNDTEDLTSNTLENLLNVYTTRGALIQNLLCASEVEDFHKKVLDFDNKEILAIRVLLLEIRYYEFI